MQPIDVMHKGSEEWTPRAGCCASVDATPPMMMQRRAVGVGAGGGATTSCHGGRRGCDDTTMELMTTDGRGPASGDARHCEASRCDRGWVSRAGLLQAAKSCRIFCALVNSHVRGWCGGDFFYCVRRRERQRGHIQRLLPSCRMAWTGTNLGLRRSTGTERCPETTQQHSCSVAYNLFPFLFGNFTL